MGTESWGDVQTTLLHLGAALVLGLPVGWEREHHRRSPGLRTFPLVAMGSCAFLLIGRHAFAGNAEAQARVVQALVTGIGFVGGGAILKDKEHVHGIATAVSIWITAGIGAAVAYGQLVLALALSLSTLLILDVLRPRGEKR
jgi:putative Mg2+ transporter-C (MgtC) family protein